MEIALNVEQQTFQGQVRTWLQQNVPDTRLAPISTATGLAAHKEWERRLYDAGFAAVDWPIEYGGGGADPLLTSIFYDEYLRVGAPARLNRIGLGLAGPTIIELGTSDQRSRWLDKILTAEHLWCQGFSEPGAGSDLAAVRTAGVVDAGNLRINGQKIWTSHALIADWMLALVRTDQAAAPHQGLTFVMLEMNTPGVAVRPIRQLNGQKEFAEVFFDDVDVPVANIIGDVNDGWTVAMTTLKFERGGGLNTAAHLEAMLREIVATLSAEQRSDPVLRRELGHLFQDIQRYRYTTLRTMSQVTLGKTVGPQSLMGKVWWSELQVRIYEWGMDLLGATAELTDESDNRGGLNSWRQRYWLARASQIYAGTNEIHRNIIAERVLGLPKEPRHAV